MSALSFDQEQLSQERLAALKHAGLSNIAIGAFSGKIRYEIVYPWQSPKTGKWHFETVNGPVRGIRIHNTAGEHPDTPKVLLELGIRRCVRFNHAPIIACGYQPVFRPALLAPGDDVLEFEAEVERGWAFLVKHKPMEYPFDFICLCSIWLYNETDLLYHCDIDSEPE